MGRFLKTGLDYFPVFCGFLDNRKIALLRAERKSAGVLLWVKLLDSIYAGDGYYLHFDDREARLLSMSLGSEYTPGMVTETVGACMDLELFDERVFREHGVLTSASIQRVYVHGSMKRRQIGFIREYMLIDPQNPDDVAEKLRPLIAITELGASEKASAVSEGIFISDTGKGVSDTGKGVSDTGNAISDVGKTQRKGKESKGKESKEGECAREERPSGEERAAEPRSPYGPYANVFLTDTEMKTLKREFPADYESRIARLSEYMRSKGKKYADHLATIRSWARQKEEPHGRHVENHAAAYANDSRGDRQVYRGTQA